MNFIIFGGGLFWTIISVIALIIICVIEIEEKTVIGWASTILILSVGFFGYFYKSNINWNINWGTTVLYSIIYFFFGIIWSFFRWGRLSKKKYKKYLEVIENNRKNFDIDIELYKPQVRENKEQITGWILYWPFSFFRYLFSNLFKDITDKIIKMLTGFYNRITNFHFNQVEVDEKNKDSRKILHD